MKRFEGLIAYLGAVGLAAFGVFTPGMDGALALGVLLAGLGAWMLVCAPRHAPPAAALLLGVAFLGGCALALLPAPPDAMPAWRVLLDQDLGLRLGDRFAAQPVLLFEWGTLAAAIVIAAWTLLGARLAAHQGVWVLAAVAVIVTAHAGVAVADALLGWNWPWDGDKTFGLFPNRNHQASLMAVGTLAALGTVRVAIARRQPLLAGMALACAGFLLVVMATFSESRSWIVLLGLGVPVWLIGARMAELPSSLKISAVTIGLLVLAIFITSTTPAWERIQSLFHATAPATPQAGPGADGDGLAFDFRVEIFQDAIRMIADHPWTGHGLGSFQYVFPQYRTHSLMESQAAHPESDWLMLAAEGGVVPVLVLAAALALASAAALQRRKEPGALTRWTGLVGFWMIAAHGLFDVPVHRPGIALVGIVLGALALSRPPEEETKPGVGIAAGFVRWGLRLAGLALLAGGIASVRGPSGHGYRAAALGGQAAANRIYEALVGNDTDRGLALAREALARTPLAPALHGLMGHLQLRDDSLDPETDRSFLIQRVLEPDWIRVPLDQAWAWHRIDPARTVGLIRRALAAASRFRPSGRALQERNRIFEESLHRYRDQPPVIARMGVIALENTEWLARWLPFASEPDRMFALERIRASDPKLERLSPTARRSILRAWSRTSSAPDLWQLLENEPALETDAWSVRAGALAREGRHEEAVRIAAAQLDFGPALDRSGSEPEDRLLDDWRTLRNPETARELVLTLLASGNSLTANRILLEALKPGSPALWELAVLLRAEQGDWNGSWAAVGGYLAAVKSDRARDF
jgi:O-antigen ligase